MTIFVGPGVISTGLTVGGLGQVQVSSGGTAIGTAVGWVPPSWQVVGSARPSRRLVAPLRRFRNPVDPQQPQVVPYYGLVIAVDRQAPRAAPTVVPPHVRIPT